MELSKIESGRKAFVEMREEFNRTRSRKNMAMDFALTCEGSNECVERRERYQNGEQVITIAGVYCRY